MKSTIILILAIGLTGGLALAQYDTPSQGKPVAKPDFDLTAHRGFRFAARRPNL